MPAYGPVTTEWVVQCVLAWGSWLLLALLSWWAWRLARRWGALSTARRLGAAALVVAVLAFVDARVIEPNWITQRTTRLELGFPARIALISDYHLGLYRGPGFLERVVDRLNALDVDVVLIAGDHLHEPDRPLAELLAPLKRLRHRALSVPGNHDEQHPGPPVQAALRQALIDVGVVPVEYTHHRLARFTVVGLGDRFAGRDGLEPLTAAPKDKPIVVLVHNPDSTMQLPRGAAALAVAGHTHGGQVRIPGLYRRVIPTEHPFDRGLHDFAPLPVFVTSGLGESGVPLRFLNPPVIDLLEVH